MENPGLTISPCDVLYPPAYPQGLSPFSLLPRNLGLLDKTPRQVVKRSSDQSWGNLVHWWKQLCLGWKKKSQIWVVSNSETIEAKPLPPVTSAQLAELIALTQDLELWKGKRAAIYIDSKYVFLVLHAHAATWKERSHLTTWGSLIKYGDPIHRLLEAVHLPSEVSVSYCKGEQKGSMEVAWGNQAGYQAAKRAALQNNDLIGVATLVPQTTLWK